MSMLPVAIRTMTFLLNLEPQYSSSRMILRRNPQLLFISTNSKCGDTVDECNYCSEVIDGTAIAQSDARNGSRKNLNPLEECLCKRITGKNPQTV